MKFKTLNNKLREVPIHKYLIDWDGKFASNFETEVANWIRPYWKNDVVTAQLKVAGTKLSLDFYNVSQKIAIEVQGRQHVMYVPFLSGTRSGYLSQLKRDLMKAKFCEINNIKLIEIFPEDLPLSKKFFKEKFNVIL